LSYLTNGKKILKIGKIINCRSSSLPDLFKLEACPGFEETTLRLSTGDWAHLHMWAALAY